jgi:hypothetical protein
MALWIADCQIAAMGFRTVGIVLVLSVVIIALLLTAASTASLSFPAAASGVNTGPVLPVTQRQGTTRDSRPEYITLESYPGVMRGKDGVLEGAQLSHPPMEGVGQGRSQRNQNPQVRNRHLGHPMLQCIAPGPRAD